MNKALLSLAVAGLAVSAVQTSFAQLRTPSSGVSSVPIIHFPQVGGKNGFFPLQQAYRLRGDVNTLASQRCAGNSSGFARNARFCGPTGLDTGTAQYPFPGILTNIPASGTGEICNGATPAPLGLPIFQAGELVTAVPGIFALCSVNRNLLAGGDPDLRQRLNCNAFATCPTNFTSPFVQSCRLIKVIPLQPKCPGVFPGATFVQFSPNIRTWWALLYSPPGTRFILQVTTRCLGRAGTVAFGTTNVHIDEYEWRVCVTVESILAVLDVLHSHPVGTSEIPCIAAEDIYLALRGAIARIACQAASTTPSNPRTQDFLFNAEALVIAFCAFGDCFIAEDFFGTFPPTNDVDLGGAFGPTGILDTIENPCCCKLLVDLDALGGGDGLGILTAGAGG